MKQGRVEWNPKKDLRGVVRRGQQEPGRGEKKKKGIRTKRFANPAYRE